MVIPVEIWILVFDVLAAKEEDGLADPIAPIVPEVFLRILNLCDEPILLSRQRRGHNTYKAKGYDSKPFHIFFRKDPCHPWLEVKKSLTLHLNLGENQGRNLAKNSDSDGTRPEKSSSPSRMMAGSR